MINANLKIMLLSLLTITLSFTVVLYGIQQVMAEDAEKGADNKTQVNTERQQINECEYKSVNEENKVECNNIVAYGVVCMPGDVCKLEKFDVPFEVVRPF